MVSPSSSPDPLVSPAQVSARLTTDLQARAIRLTAQLAWNLIVTEIPRLSKEAENAQRVQHPQTPV